MVGAVGTLTKELGKMSGFTGALLILLVIPLLILLTAIAIPFTFFFGWLEGKIAMWVLGSHIIAGLHALGVTQITAANFPTICGAISVVASIINPIHISNTSSS